LAHPGFQSGSTTGPIVFENLIDRSDITFKMNNSVTPRKHQIEAMLAGVAVFDYNNDGLMDLFFVNGARLPDELMNNRVTHRQMSAIHLSV
jgi:hypothetical protein